MLRLPLSRSSAYLQAREQDGVERAERLSELKLGQLRQDPLGQRRLRLEGEAHLQHEQRNEAAHRVVPRGLQRSGRGDQDGDESPHEVEEAQVREHADLVLHVVREARGAELVVNVPELQVHQDAVGVLERRRHGVLDAVVLELQLLEDLAQLERGHVASDAEGLVVVRGAVHPGQNALRHHGEADPN
eukprot:scaffold1366_cov233-Pinguiococcus_pyrenoidosus.AAC.3